MVLAAGVGMLLWTWAYVASAARAEAVVVVEDAKDDAGNKLPDAMKAKLWHAEFTDRKGLRQRFFLGASMEMSLGALKLAEVAPGYPPPGSKIPILFDPSNPKRAKRDTFAELWRTPVVVALVGAALAICSAIAVIAIIRDLQ